MDTAQNGQEAVTAVRNQDRSYYSAIILDIDMPIMNGMDACIDIQSYLNEEKMADLKLFQNVPYVYALTAEVDE